MRVEFKSEHRQALADRDIVLAVVCLANSEGGSLYLGVENDGGVTGTDGSHHDAVRLARGATRKPQMRRASPGENHIHTNYGIAGVVEVCCHIQSVGAPDQTLDQLPRTSVYCGGVELVSG